MKTLLTTVFLLYGTSFSIHFYPAISQDEMTFLLDLMAAGEDEIQGTVSDLNEEQWSFQPEDGGWTIGQCLDHIISAEKGLMQQIKQALKEEPRQDVDTRHLDGWLLTKIADRGVKVNTPLPTPAATISKQEALDQFQASRKQFRSFLANENLPLRSHFGKSPYGPADCYQLMLVVAAHTLRHHAQMEEILDEYEKTR